MNYYHSSFRKASGFFRPNAENASATMLAMALLRRYLPVLLTAVSASWAADPVVDWDKVRAETLQHYQSVVRIDSTNPPGNETTVVNYLKGVLDREGIAYS